MDVIAELTSLIGADAVLTDPADLDAVTEDWRGRYRGPALCLARPANAGQVADVVRCCARHGVPVLPQGGNTSLCGGAVPSESGPAPVILSLTRMRAVRAIDPVNSTMEVEAGCVLATVQEAAAAAGRLYPVSLGAEGLLPDRRHHRHQRRRHLGPALRQHARERAGAGGRAGRWHRLVWPLRPAQEQHRLRSEASVHRLGRHARRHHGGDAEAAPAADAPRGGLGRDGLAGGRADPADPRAGAQRGPAVRLRDDQPPAARSGDRPCPRPPQPDRERGRLACADRAVGQRLRRGARRRIAGDP
ncbi:protein of unknown function (plasmid) [Azospirillum baldaniorum]|uniref:FAD-binding PCMH-type domain-containing protein n=1 Tax=Azospirillum baldaniorum TaxID=1064539 RepID=A0A9P1JYV0_9PROT|nr:protein of unknown function [Azospirillum baldaniorum]